MHHQGSQFLHQRNAKLHASPEVEAVVDYLRAGGESIPNQPDEKVSAYLGFLSNKEYANDGILTGDEESIRRQVDALCITKLPESDIKLQQRIALERGQGRVMVTQFERDRRLQIIQQDQRHSLMSWANYLSSGNVHYPDWFKLYAWNAVTKMGSYDSEKKAYEKRTASTTSPFPELDYETLAITYEAVKTTYIDHAQYDRVDQISGLDKALGSANFSKMYAYVLDHVTSARRNDAAGNAEIKKPTEGEWRVFKQTEDAAVAHELADSLSGHGTRWCVAAPEMAANYLEDGDFYIYYSVDRNGENKIPRLAIHTNTFGEITEVRGVQGKQEVEGVMLDIVKDKLGTFPGGDQYFDTVEDVRRVTKFSELLQKDPAAELSIDDLRFLYEIDREIKYFGEEKDERISALRDVRDTSKDAEQIIGRSLDMDHIGDEIEHLTEQGLGVMGLSLIGRVGVVDGRDLLRIISNPDFERVLEESEFGWSTYHKQRVANLIYERLDGFRNIPSNVMPALIEVLHKRDPGKILQHLDAFTPRAQSMLIKDWVQTHDTWEIADNLGLLKNLDTATVRLLIRAGETESIAANLSSFSPQARKYAAKAVGLFSDDFDDDYDDDD